MAHELERGLLADNDRQVRRQLGTAGDTMPLSLVANRDNLDDDRSNVCGSLLAPNGSVYSSSKLPAVDGFMVLTESTRQGTTREPLKRRRRGMAVGHSGPK